jgi:hypothetical protein
MIRLWRGHVAHHLRSHPVSLSFVTIARLADREAGLGLEQSLFRLASGAARSAFAFALYHRDGG